MLFQELSFFFVVTPSSDTGDDGNSEKNSCSINPSMADSFRSSEWGIYNNRENSGCNKNFKHEVIESSKQKITELSSCWSILVVATESQFSSFNRQGTGTELDTSLECISKSIRTIEFILDVSDIFDVLSLSVTFDYFDKWIFGYLKLLIGRSPFGVVNICKLSLPVSVTWHLSVNLSY